MTDTSPDAGAIGQESVLYKDSGEVLCKGAYQGTKDGRVWILDEKGRSHSFPADKYDMRPARE